MSGMRQPSSSAASRPASRASTQAPVSAPVQPPTLKRAQVPSVLASSTSVNTAANSNHAKEQISSETNIQVVVRCRDRNARERAENSGVIVSTVAEPRGKAITVQTSPSTLSNKTYAFDRVYGAEASQQMVFDDTVEPIVEEMLGGYNCTIFAYGQTGTGKTYTMSGDMSDYYGKVTDGAGIIPRALYRIFKQLDAEGDEYSVKCSFIELYNEELRDLLAIEEDRKVKIFDDNAKKGGVVISGMEEVAVQDAITGVKILQEGSKRREVAATKCNEASSRSHSVFTITVHIKQTTDGEDMLRVGKLNLVDLAGSENVGRSGAENKRAREAGMINQSLLTLGRVINALVDRSQHIPYRESKLTRLLQDSLGGRTKTCIIATISPAKINMDETVSTLDYASRAKSIKNKPQVNQMMTKKSLIKDYILEIERLKADLNSTRSKNGIYMTEASHLDLVNENESNKLLTEEQQRKIDAVEGQLRAAKEQFEETMEQFLSTRKELEGTTRILGETKEVLSSTKIELQQTSTALSKETILRRAHQESEAAIDNVAKGLVEKLEATVRDVHGLHDKVGRKRTVEERNAALWESAGAQIAHAVSQLDNKLETFAQGQKQSAVVICNQVTSLAVREMKRMTEGQAYISQRVQEYDAVQTSTEATLDEARQRMNAVLDEIRDLRVHIKSRLGEGLAGLGKAAERIADEIATRLGAFQQEVHDNYSQLGSDFKAIFDATQKHMSAQAEEIKTLRAQVAAANSTTADQIQIAARLLLEQEHANADKTAEAEALALAQIESLLKNVSQQRAERELAAQESFKQRVALTAEAIHKHSTSTSASLDEWLTSDADFSRRLQQGKESIKRSIVESAKSANARTEAIQQSTHAIHAETVALVDAAMSNVDSQTQALEEHVAAAKKLGEQHHSSHLSAVQYMRQNVDSTAATLASELGEAKSTIEQVSRNVADEASGMDPAITGFCQFAGEAHGLVKQAAATELQKDLPTRTTPKKQKYVYATSWPTTLPHAQLLGETQEAVETPRLALAQVDPNVTSPTMARETAEVPGQPQPLQAVASSIPAPVMQKQVVNMAAGQENGRAVRTRKRMLGSS
ncbi:P-loop containing nucleoside triphosphate hydrolase protein [Protomyces lactucae-debilis]|uniref:p-loop containing nucleoside triphosphate hydrolase protein n=1 Tax=Protomyces lactucae-debilis TaxID=2754530 RepID=A0A1Y2FI73_PROLT|nr:P-loop containing nucleoside triphosphate hydrolase protein [Protomyces lactucae-debilis]ORY82515.1 P-loop containing nucleoside triphosphate hydrolase protein [Protomyces lactucae-debilis]